MIDHKRIKSGERLNLLYTTNCSSHSATSRRRRKPFGDKAVWRQSRLAIYTMSGLKQALTDKIQANRPKLGANSIKTYVSILKSLYTSMNASGDSIEWFSDHVDDIIQHLENKGDVSKKTILSSLYVLTGDNKYREIMMKTMKIVTYPNIKKSMLRKLRRYWIRRWCRLHSRILNR